MGAAVSDERRSFGHSRHVYERLPIPCQCALAGADQEIDQSIDRLTVGSKAAGFLFEDNNAPAGANELIQVRVFGRRLP